MIIAGIVILFLGGRFIFFFMPIVVIDLTLLFFTFILEFFNYFQNVSKNAVIFLIIPGIIGFIGVIVSVISLYMHLKCNKAFNGITASVTFFRLSTIFSKLSKSQKLTGEGIAILIGGFIWNCIGTKIRCIATSILGSCIFLIGISMYSGGLPSIDPNEPTYCKVHLNIYGGSALFLSILGSIV